MSEQPASKRLSLNVLPDRQNERASMDCSQPTPLPEVGSAGAGNELEQKIIAVLHKIYDPEIPVDIYELGLIYGIEITPDNAVTIRMTLTAPACPVAETLPLEVERKIEAIAEVAHAKVDLVWDPPWDRDRLSEAAKLQLGLL